MTKRWIVVFGIVAISLSWSGVNAQPGSSDDWQGFVQGTEVQMPTQRAPSLFPAFGQEVPVMYGPGGAEALLNAVRRSQTPEGQDLLKSFLPQQNTLDGFPPAAPPLGASFTGPAWGGIWIPGDPVIAAGSTYVGVMINSQCDFYTKAGVWSGGSILKVFFAPVYDSLNCRDPFDVKIIYDHHANKWVMLALTYCSASANSYYLVAVSQTMNPLGSWWIWALDVMDPLEPVPLWADYPGLGFDADSGVYITSNQYLFGGGFQYAKIRALRKGALYTGTAAWWDYWGMIDADGITTTFTIKPVHTFGNPGTEYLVNSKWAGGNTVDIWSVLPGDPFPMNWGAVGIGWYFPPPIPPCSDSGLNLFDCRTQDAQYRNEYVYTSFHEEWDWGAGIKAVVRFLKIDIPTMTPAIDERYGHPEYHYFFPSIYSAPNDNIVTVFNRCGGTEVVEFPSARYSARFLTQGDVASRASLYLQAGQAWYGDWANPNRWGDYSGIAYDPFQFCTMWIYSMYSTNAPLPANWSTWIGSVFTHPGEGGDSLYWKPEYEDYAPSGMVDIDQKQDNWIKTDNGRWTFCGPAAVANCFKWFDSKYNVPPGFPGDGNDQFPLVRDYMDNLPSFFAGVWDDHDPWNVDHVNTPWGPPANPPPATPQPFIPGAQPQPSGMPAWGELVERLAWYFDTDGIQSGYCAFSGTKVQDMQNGIDQWLLSEQFSDGSTLWDSLYERTLQMPSFAEVETLVEMCEDVILLLGFWYEDPAGSGDWWRCGGHYVTVAGINSDSLLIALSDPWYDNAEAGGRGRIGTGNYIAHVWPHTDPTIHNDEGNVSHDIYTVSTDPVSPGGLWELVDYPVTLNPSDCYNFEDMNVPDEHIPVSQPWTGVSPIFTEVEYAVVISPRTPPDTLRNHFKTWRVEPEPFTQIVSVQDQFMQDNLVLDQIDFLSNPTRKDSFEIVDGIEHLTWYRAHGRDTLLEVEYTNQFGTYTNTIDSVKYLLLPTAKELPEPFPEELDHYKAYRIKNPVAFDRTVELEDQFDLLYGVTESIETLKPVYFLTPALKNMPPPMFDSVTHYVAYEILPEHHYGLLSVETFDQFGEHALQVDTSKMLLVPTGKLRAEPPPHNPPEIGQPDFLEGYVESVVEYDITGNDPDGDVILDEASIDIQPGCGSWNIVRTSGHGTSTGVWRITWDTEGCTPCDTHMVIHDLTDETGLVGYCTTWVHLSEKPWLNHKMHHPQLPDLEGWDVFALDPKTLADDWQCSETGWVKDIHFWGSWRDLDGDPSTDDFYTPMPWFRLSIHRNIPASADTPWSRPGEQIWSWEGEIQGTPFEPPAMEHWFNPNTNEVLYNDHVPYWRYDFFFDLADPLPAPFYQHKDSVYWLDVSAIGIPAPYEWGWKSSRDHFMDDAVYTDTPPDGPWYPLFEPPRANWFDVYFNSAGEPVDMGSTNYYGEGWYAYEYWWNMWFYNNPFVTNPKHIWLEFYVEEVGPAAYVEFAINWSTDLWSTEGVPGRPPLPGEDETLYIGREIFEVLPGWNTIDFWITDYNPEWVSIDFVGVDVIINGWIWHECVQTSMDLAFVITGEAPPDTLRNHYKTWWFAPEMFEGTVFVQDQFMEDSLSLVRSDFLSNPVKKVVENDTFDIIRPDDHLTWYMVSGRDTLIQVGYVNQFESTTVAIDVPKFLLVPTQKGDHLPPENLDHYKAYRIQNPVEFPVELVLEDQFDIMYGAPEDIDSLKPRYFLTPAIKNMEQPQLFDSVTHYVAYEISPRRPFSLPVDTWDQFGSHVLYIQYSEMLLVPSKKFLVTVPESLYWKPSYEDYAPSGMPDIDQKQDNWMKAGTGSYTFCGPVAVANCFKWFDSKYNVPPGAPGDGMDQFPLVRDYLDNLAPFIPPARDDHDPWNVDHAGTPWGPPANPPPATAQPFIPGPQPQPSTMPAWGELVERLAWYFNTDGIQTGYCMFSGTNVYDMQNGIEEWFLSEQFEDGSTIADSLYEYTIPMPTFAEIETLVEMCEDVILLLGFWYEDPPGSGDWWRCGGHYVTVAGVNSEDLLIAVADPFFDNAEAGGRGRVGDGTLIAHLHGSHDGTVHNDEGNVSHDIYSVSTDAVSPGGQWELVDYPVTLNPGYCYDFSEQNIPPEFEPVTQPWTGTSPIFTEVEYAVVISPRNHPPEIGQPDFLEGLVDDTVQYDITGTDPNGDVILDSASIVIVPGCGTYSITRTSGHGTSTGTWQVTWLTTGCTPCDTHIVIHDLTDEHGATGYCTTYVHLSSPRECDDNDPHECDTLYVECGNMLVPPGGGLVKVDMSIAYDETLKAVQVPLSYQGSPECCDSMPENENTVAQVFAGSILPATWIKVVTIDHQAKEVVVAGVALMPPTDCLMPGRGHLGTLTLFGDSCCTIQLDTTDYAGNHVGFMDCNDPSMTLFYPVCRIDTCHIDRNYPPEIGQPDFLEGLVDDLVTYTITGNDPDGDVIRDTASIDIQPGCGSGYYITRISGHGTSSGTWEIRWYTDGCTPCDTHMVIHDLTDANGFTSYCTTWVHLSEPESLYWKPPYEDYAPNGMVDIDQKQDGWLKFDTDQWSFCGPCAVANCFKWFDSKYNQPPGVPGDAMDQFPLVRDYTDNLPGIWLPTPWDDHSPENVDHTGTPWAPGIGPPPPTPQPFVPGPQPPPVIPNPWGELVERLAWFFDTDGIQSGYCNHTGTNILQMQQGIQDWLDSEMFPDGSLLADTLCQELTLMPSFAYVESLVEKCEDVILLLGFWYEDPPGSGQWFRIGGHYVTVAGVNSETQRIAFSDPFIDAAEFGAPGRVGDGMLIPHVFPHDPRVHNDEGNVSHDIYTADTNSISPGGDWWLPDYAINGDPGYWSWNFHRQNVPDEFLPFTASWNGTSPIFTEVEYCIHISPWDYRGDVAPTGGNGVIDVGDAVYILNYLFKAGPAPDPYIEGDANCDGFVNLSDAITILNYLFKGWGVPRCCDP